MSVQQIYVFVLGNNLGPVYMGSDPNGFGSIWIRSTFVGAFIRDRIQNRWRLHGIGSIWIL